METLLWKFTLCLHLLCLYSHKSCVSVHEEIKNKAAQLHRTFEGRQEKPRETERESQTGLTAARDKSEEHWDVKCKLRPQIETVSKAEYSGLVTHYGYRIYEQKGKEMERKKKENIWESARVISCTKHRSIHLPGSKMSRISDTFKTSDAVR